MPKSADDKAEQIARRQRGLITHAQARVEAGLTDAQIRKRIASGRWQRRHRGVSAMSGVPSSWEQSLLAAQLAARTEEVVEGRKRRRLEVRDDALVCGSSALWLRGCSRLGKPECHELLVAHSRNVRIPGTLIRRTRVLRVEDVEVIDGVATLAIPRLLLESCGRMDDTDFVAVVNDVLDAAANGVREETYALTVAMGNGRRGVGRLAELTHPEAAERFRSWLERHANRLFCTAQLPPAHWNLELHDDAGKLVGIGDAVWTGERVVVELDGLRFHSPPQQRRRDNRKDRRLGTLGWLVLRYTWLDLVERPDEVVAEIAAALAARSPRRKGGRIG